MRARIILPLFVLALLILSFWYFRASRPVPTASSSPEARPGALTSAIATASDVTNVYAHNLMLRKGPTFRVYVQWLRGEIVRTARNIDPSFDEPDSFVLDVKTGVIHTNVGDLTNFLNDALTNSPLTNVALSGDGDQLRIRGTLHKIVPLPVEITGKIGVVPGNRVRLQVTNLSVLKIPFKGLLGDVHLTVSGLFHSGIPGVEVSGNDIFFDPVKLLPPPHIRGELTSVRIVNPDFEEVYGNATEDVEKVAEWRNFLRFRGGTLDFGKLTMHDVDVIMVDLSNDAWFDLDLTHYQEQIVNGYTRMTPQAGLQIFMPDLEKIPKTPQNQQISLEWLKNRNLPPPPDITLK